MAEETLIKVAQIGGPVVIVVLIFLYFIWKIIRDFVKPIADKFHTSLDANTKATIGACKISEQTYKYLKIQNGTNKSFMVKILGKIK